MRNKLYDWGTLSAVSFDLPTIAVGNLSMGGTGKTPHVEYLIALLKSHYRVATLSRGYNRRTHGYRLAGPDSDALEIGDEPMQFHRKFPDIAVCVGEERVLALPQLLMDKPETAVVLLDDAFQHRSIRPGYNILLTEHSRLFTRDYIVPFGRLRESRQGYRRADCIIVTKCPPALSEEERLRITREIAPLPAQPLYFTALQYGEPYDLFTGAAVSIPESTALLLVCGIARPAPLQEWLQQRFASVTLQQFPDHHYFTPADVAEIRSSWEVLGAEQKMVITTEKDAVKLQLLEAELRDQALPICVLPAKVSFLFDSADSFNNHIFDYVAKALEEQQNP
ncbi:tetraacyldisaccharide 4'-kinase [Compostibacter hankyongensis]|uniref:Tetraacyldisaccharide 4'-kinase n=1 Tax=Compostibacter hankyongensis TaxID=1007089 RepID=A0ABP8FN81_9BACT